MGENEHLLYGSYPRDWSDDELDHLAIEAITQILEVKKKNRAKTSKNDQPVSIDNESIRSALESGTHFRLGLLPLDMAVRRVASYNENGQISGLNDETLKKLQRLETPKKLEK